MRDIIRKYQLEGNSLCYETKDFAVLQYSPPLLPQTSNKIGYTQNARNILKYGGEEAVVSLGHRKENSYGA